MRGFKLDTILIFDQTSDILIMTLHLQHPFFFFSSVPVSVDFNFFPYVFLTSTDAPELYITL